MKEFLHKSKYHLLEKISPQAAGKAAARLWFTPPKYAPVLPEKMFLETAAKKRIPFEESRHQMTVETYYTLYGWGKGPLVLLVHGWGGSAAQMAPLAKSLVEAGFQVLAFDALAHGDSPGRQTDVLEMKDVIQDIAGRFDGIHAVLGYSMGALATILAVADGAKPDRVVTVNSAASLDYYFKQFTTALNVGRPMSGRIAVSIGSGLRKNITDFSLLQIVPALHCPALILHDQNDEVVDYHEALALAKCWPYSELCITTGLGHAGFLHDKGTVERVTQYLLKPQIIPAESTLYST